MRFAVNIPNFGDFADPRLVADLARRVEEAGWDGLFVWDHITHHKELRREIASGAPSRRRLPSSLRSSVQATPRPFGSPRSARARPCRSRFVQGVRAFLRGCREEAGRMAEPFDLIVSGSSAPETAADVTGPLAEAGATWWQECAWDENLERAKPMLRRVEAGPPR